jgi:hypothetical protein
MFGRSPTGSKFELIFQDESFFVPKPSLMCFFEARPDLLAGKSYDVQSTVPVDIFRDFVSSLSTNTELVVTSGNAGSLSLLASEFSFLDLSAECAKHIQDAVSLLEARISKLEQHPALPHPDVDLSRFDDHEQRLEQLSARLASLNNLERTVWAAEARFDKAVSEMKSSRTAVERAVTEMKAGFERQLQDLRERFGQMYLGLDGTVSETKGRFQKDIIDLQETLSQVRDGVGRLARANGQTQTQMGEIGESVKKVQAEVKQLTTSTSRFDGEIADLKSFRASAARQSNPTPPIGRVFDFNRGSPLEGILAYLTEKCQRNVHDAGIVDITSSSVAGQDMDHHPKLVVESGDRRHFGTARQNNPWVCFNFKNRRIVPTNYVILTDHDTPPSRALLFGMPVIIAGWDAVFTTCWVIEASMDGTNWTTIDERTSVQVLNGPNLSVAMTVERPAECRFLRIRGTHRDQRPLEFKRFEIFGRLIDPTA